MASPTSQQRYGAAEEGLLERLRGVAGSLTGYLRARLELAGLEGAEAVSLYLKMLLWGIAAVALIFVGYLLLNFAAVAVLSRIIGWGWGVFSLALFHFLAAGACIFMLRKKSKTPVFSATLQEFQRDEQWLKTDK